MARWGFLSQPLLSSLQSIFFCLDLHLGQSVFREFFLGGGFRFHGFVYFVSTPVLPTRHRVQQGDEPLGYPECARQGYTGAILGQLLHSGCDGRLKQLPD